MTDVRVVAILDVVDSPRRKLPKEEVLKTLQLSRGLLF